jgi:hypothetical protein
MLVTITPSEMAIAKLTELIEADDSLPQAVRKAMVSDLTAQRADELVAFKRVLSGEDGDEAHEAQGK